MHAGSEALFCFHPSASPSSSQPGSGSLTAIKECLDTEETTFICTQHQALPEWQLERSAKSECINYSCPWEPISYLLPLPFQNVRLKFLLLSSGWERGSQSSLIWGSLGWFVRLPPWLLFSSSPWLLFSSCQTRLAPEPSVGSDNRGCQERSVSCGASLTCPGCVVPELNPLLPTVGIIIHQIWVTGGVREMNGLHWAKTNSGKCWVCTWALVCLVGSEILITKWARSMYLQHTQGVLGVMSS